MISTPPIGDFLESVERRLSAADTVIYNTGLSLEQLADEVRQIAQRFGLSSG